MQYDIVGDIHGHADALEALLQKLGYTYRMGAWRHPERHMLFLGDFVDRGPDQLRSIDIPRRMRDAGSATALMGNHEFNAIGWATENPLRPGHHYRIRGSKNRHQHRAFLEAVGDDTPLHKELVGWFKTLPLWIETEHFRAIHACWHPAQQAVLAPHLDAGNAMTEEGLHALFAKGSDPYEAAEIVLKGLEIPLPEGVSFRDKDGTERRKTRIRWWDESARTYRSSALLDMDVARHIPDDPLPERSCLAYDDAKPLFFGHYWMDGDPGLISATKACLDWSIAKGGSLAAYQHDGEPALDPAKLVWVSPNLAPAPAF